MTFLIALLAVTAVLWLISLIRLGGRLRYTAGGFFVTIFAGPYCLQPFSGTEKPGPEGGGFQLSRSIGPFWSRLFPMTEKARRKAEKKEREKKQKPKKEKPPREKRKDGPGALSRLMELVPTALAALGALRRRIQVDDLALDLVWGGSDPASAAIGYGQANAAMGILWPLVEHNFKVKRHQLRINIDYGRTQPAVEVTAAFTITVGQILYLAVRYGVKALIQWIRGGRSVAKRQEA